MAKLFRAVAAAETIHAHAHLRAMDGVKGTLEAVTAGQDIPAAQIKVCPVCGHTVVGDAPDECPICHAKGARFAEIA